MAGSQHPRRVPGEERVFSLVLALVASPQGLTKAELLSSVYGYAERYDPSNPDPSVERQFERDKTQVRELGIPIETLDSPLEQGNNQLTRYRISKELLQLPEDIRFSAEELTLLKLASLAWSEGSLDDRARWAKMKLTSLGVNREVQSIGITPQIGMFEPAAPALQRAIDESKVVRFDYQLPGNTESLRRRVAPLRLHRAEGRWHLIAHDLERSANRVFLLSRITSDVHIEADSFNPDLAASAEEEITNLALFSRSQRALVRVTRGSVAEARLEGREATEIEEASTESSSVLSVGTLDLSSFADELAGFGEDAEALAPDELRDLVLARLRRIALQHQSDSRNASDVR